VGYSYDARTLGINILNATRRDQCLTWLLYRNKALDTSASEPRQSSRGDQDMHESHSYLDIFVF
jgi:hypothetical protein